MVQKRVVLGGLIIVWAVALQGHMMWLKRQEGFKYKFGELKGEAPVGQMQVVCWECNCSVCTMRQNLHFIVPSTDFELEDDAQQWLTEYTFGTRQAKHLFCKVCGICSYYIPRSNPDGIAVTVHCLDPGTLKSTEVKKFDGQNWESAFTASSVSACSEKL